jgi:hypothetical protein
VAISASLAPDIGGKERKYMTNNANYTDAPAEIEQALESAMTIDDVLPSPSELVRKTEKEKITIAKYQTMINGVLSSYADKFLSHK